MPQVHFIYSGRFVYDMMTVLDLRLNRKAYVTSIFVNNSPAANFFLSIMQQIENSFPSTTFLEFRTKEATTVINKRKSKNHAVSRSKRRKTNRAIASRLSSSEDNESNDEPDRTVLNNCEVSNTFAQLLNMEDE